MPEPTPTEPTNNEKQKAVSIEQGHLLLGDISSIPKQNQDLILMLVEEIVGWFGERYEEPVDTDGLVDALGEVRALIKSNCERCFADIHGAILEGHGKAARADERRQYHLLRFVACSFSDLLQSGGFDRRFLSGLEAYLEHLLGSYIYNDLNEECRLLLDELGPLSDDEIWRQALAGGWRRMLALHILFRIVSQFRNFDRSVRTFLVTIENASLVGTPSPTGHLFRIFFDRLAEPLMTETSDDDDRAWFDFLFGETGRKTIDEIWLKYTHWKNSQAAEPTPG